MSDKGTGSQEKEGNESLFEQIYLFINEKEREKKKGFVPIFQPFFQLNWLNGSPATKLVD